MDNDRFFNIDFGILLTFLIALLVPFFYVSVFLALRLFETFKHFASRIC